MSTSRRRSLSNSFNVAAGSGSTVVLKFPVHYDKEAEENSVETETKQWKHHENHDTILSRFLDYAPPEDSIPFRLDPRLESLAPPAQLPNFKSIDHSIKSKHVERTKIRLGKKQRAKEDDEDNEYCQCKGRKQEENEMENKEEEKNPANNEIAADGLPIFPLPSSAASRSASSDESSFNCGDRCLNRAVFIECNESNCKLPPELCSNRSFARYGNQAHPDTCVPFRTELKGWGLRAARDLKAGEFVIEYLGEIIDNAECQRRIDAENAKIAERLALVKQTAKKIRNANRTSSPKRSKLVDHRALAEVTAPRAANYYFLTITDDAIIDAGRKGSIARFFNHSCNPNCIVQKWIVGNDIRVGMFVKDEPIKAGTELTIDYQYDRIGKQELQRCYCGEENCSGEIGGLKKGENRQKLTAEQAKRARKREKARAIKEAKEAAYQNADEVCAECGDGGDLILCDALLPDGRHCPRSHHPACALEDPEAGPPEVNGVWTCPYHFCYNTEECPSRKSVVFCVGCVESYCAICYQKPHIRARLRPINDEVRRWYDKLPENSSQCIFIICSTCADEPVVMKAHERAKQWLDRPDEKEGKQGEKGIRHRLFNLFSKSRPTKNSAAAGS